MKTEAEKIEECITTTTEVLTMAKNIKVKEDIFIQSRKLLEEIEIYLKSTKDIEGLTQALKIHVVLGVLDALEKEILKTK